MKAVAVALVCIDHGATVPQSPKAEIGDVAVQACRPVDGNGYETATLGRDGCWNLKQHRNILAPISVVVEGEYFLASNLALVRKYFTCSGINVRPVKTTKALTGIGAQEQRRAPQLCNCRIIWIAINRRRYEHRLRSEPTCNKVVRLSVKECLRTF